MTKLWPFSLRIQRELKIILVKVLLFSDEECESSSESEVDRREYVREQRQDRSRQLREAIGRARGRR